MIWGYMSTIKSGIEIDSEENVFLTAGKKSFTGLGTRLYGIDFVICVEDIDDKFHYFQRNS